MTGKTFTDTEKNKINKTEKSTHFPTGIAIRQPSNSRLHKQIVWAPCGFFNSVIILNAILSIAGSSHQGHERFSEISRGRQCCFMSFSALLCAQSFPVQHWDTATVDQILIEGDRMYLNALESQRIPDTDTLSLIYLPNQARSTVQSTLFFFYSCVLKTSLLFMNVHNITL